MRRTAVFYGGARGFSTERSDEVAVDGRGFIEEHAGEITIADLNADGRPDLIVTAGGDAAQVFWNRLWNGRGNLRDWPRTTLPANSPMSAAVGDFNRDGLLDVAIGGFAAPGTIEGHVIRAAAGNNLKQVRVKIDGTALEAFTNESGEFRLAGVPAGEVTVRASVAALGQQSARVRVAAGQVTRKDFDLGARDTTTARTAMRDQVVRVHLTWSAPMRRSAACALPPKPTTAECGNSAIW